MNETMNEELNPIEYALNQCVECGIRESLAHPFVQNGAICATDGHVLLIVRSASKELMSEYKEQDSPNTSAVLVPIDKSHYRGDITTDQMLLTPVDDDVVLVGISGTNLLRKEYIRLMEVTQMLGINGWSVYQGDSRLLFVGEDVIMLIMGNTTDKNTVKHIDIVLNNTSLTFTTDIRLGKSYCENHKRNKEEHEADLATKRHGNLWDVVVAKYAHFYVEAADFEEAKKLAREQCYDAGDDIFDDYDIELEGIVDGNVNIDDVPDRRDCIYANGEWMNKDEYEEYLEE